MFVESNAFSRYLPLYLSDNEYQDLQTFLMQRPDAGNLIQGTGGLRKIRWAAKGRGKRGGVRIIYYWYVAKARIYLLTLYSKNEMTELSTQEKAILADLVEAWKHEQKT